MTVTTEEILDRIKDECPECLLADGFEDALIGVVDGWTTRGDAATRNTVACYDYDVCVEILVRRDGMDQDGAEEFLEFNTLDAWGPLTPLFLHRWR